MSLCKCADQLSYPSQYFLHLEEYLKSPSPVRWLPFSPQPTKQSPASRSTSFPHEWPLCFSLPSKRGSRLGESVATILRKLTFLRSSCEVNYNNLNFHACSKKYIVNCHTLQHLSTASPKHFRFKDNKDIIHILTTKTMREIKLLIIILLHLIIRSNKHPIVERSPERKPIMNSRHR